MTPCRGLSPASKRAAEVGESGAEVSVATMTAVLRQVQGLSLKTGQPVDVVAATKTIWDERLNMAVEAGVKIFGENYAQDFSRKATSFDHLPVTWHFIGHLQRNKARTVVGAASLIQTVDSEDLAEHLERICTKRGVTQEVLVQVNVDEDPAKSGAAPGLAPSLCGFIETQPRLRLRGLMVLTERTGTPERRESYHRARELFDFLAPHHGENFDILSMGMSEDFREAIEAGSTMVRLGSVLFGERAVKAQG